MIFKFFLREGIPFNNEKSVTALSADGVSFDRSMIYPALEIAKLSALRNKVRHWLLGYAAMRWKSSPYDVHSYWYFCYRDSWSTSMLRTSTGLVAFTRNDIVTVLYEDFKWLAFSTRKGWGYLHMLCMYTLCGRFCIICSRGSRWCVERVSYRYAPQIHHFRTLPIAHLSFISPPLSASDEERKKLIDERRRLYGNVFGPDEHPTFGITAVWREKKCKKEEKNNPSWMVNVQKTNHCKKGTKRCS